MKYTIYSKPTRSLSVYQANARSLSHAIDLCTQLAATVRDPLEIRPQNPRMGTIKFTLKQEPIHASTL